MKACGALLILLFCVMCEADPEVQLHLNYVMDCDDLYFTQSGVYTISPTGAPVKVYCDMDTDGTKWTVIQRRVDGTLNFYRPWAQYKAGFGDASGEYWLGLENMHFITKWDRTRDQKLSKVYQLRVDMEDFEGNTASASYSSFSVGSEADGYKLQVAGFTDGGAGDSLTAVNGMKFTTFDKSVDGWNRHCAWYYYGAFWYNKYAPYNIPKCFYTHPNGVYLWGPTDYQTTPQGVVWRTWKGDYYSLKAIAMKIRRVPIENFPELEGLRG